MNIGWMHACFTTRRARPFGLGAYQSNSRATGVVMHFPIAIKKHIDVVIGKEVRCAVGAVNDSQLPGVINLWL